MTVLDSVRPRLEQLEREGLLRSTVVSAGVGGRLEGEDGTAVLNFSCNDYLNLACNAHVKRRAQQAIERWGCGATASRLMAGTLALHEELEAALARLTGAEASLVFASGFSMNVGLLFALAGRGDTIFADRLSHASLIDGARLSGAGLRRYAHNDPASLERLLRSASTSGQRFIVCESVFSMDGDIAPLADLEQLAAEYDAMLLVDEAHAVGVFGEGGGVLRELGLPLAPLTVATLGKALGSLGGFLACSRELREYAVNRTRSFIYSTALPPPSVAAALGAIEEIERDPAMGRRLLELARGFHSALCAEGLHLPKFCSQILPVPVGDNVRALELASRLRQRGLLVTAVRPPTVPEGTARLRLSVTLAHSAQDLARAASEIGEAARALGVA
jgi:8-amino-7-oxononanoate synthase